MNQANTFCLIALVVIMYALGKVLCFGLNAHHLGGWGPMGLMMILPVVGYLLGRTYDSKDPEVF